MTNDTVHPASRRNQEQTVADYENDRLLSGLFATDVDAVSIDVIPSVLILGFFGDAGLPTQMILLSWRLLLKLCAICCTYASSMLRSFQLSLMLISRLGCLLLNVNSWALVYHNFILEVI